MGRLGHVPLWPNYFSGNKPHYNLFLLEGRNLYDKNGHKIECTTYQDVRTTLLHSRGIAFVQSLSTDIRLLHEILQISRDKVSCSKNGVPISLQIKERNQRRKIIQATAWGERTVADISFLQYLENVYAECNIGIYGTPGALGKGLMFDTWYRHMFSSYTSPNQTACNYLKQHGFGGRCDTPGIGQTFPVAIELDMSSAYLAHSFPLPVGTSLPFTDGNVERFATWFGRVKITIHNELALGPFPLRLSQRKEKITYPTLPGVYYSYLWKEQAEDCLQAGCNIEVENGFGWKEFSNDMETFAREAYQLRMSLFGTAEEDGIKKAIVASFGRFGMNGEFYSLTSTCSPGDIWLPTPQGPTGLYIHKEPHDYSQPSMMHWYSYILMQCARTLYKIALPYAIEGRLIATNYDAVFVVEKDESKQYVRKYTLAAQSAKMAELRWSRLRNFECLDDRSYKAQLEMPDGLLYHRQITPGISH